MLELKKTPVLMTWKIVIKFGLSPCPLTVTTRIMIFSARDPYKSSLRWMVHEICGKNSVAIEMMETSTFCGFGTGKKRYDLRTGQTSATWPESGMHKTKQTIQRWAQKHQLQVGAHNSPLKGGVPKPCSTLQSACVFHQVLWSQVP